MKSFVFVLGFLGVILFCGNTEAGQNYESITVTSTTAIGLTATNYASSSIRAVPEKAFITCETYPVRFRYDGTSPTNAIGHKFLVDDVLVVEGIDDMARIKFISIDTGDATLRVSYE